MNAIRSKPKHDIQLGEVLGERFAFTVEETIIEQAESLVLGVSDDEAETIKARCLLAYRRELARCLAEHFARLAGE